MAAGPAIVKVEVEHLQQELAELKKQLAESEQQLAESELERQAELELRVMAEKD